MSHTYCPLAAICAPKKEREREKKKEQLRREGTQEERLQLDLGGEKVVLSETV